MFDAGEYIIWNWTSTDWLDFQLFDPDGDELMNQEQSVGTNGILPVSITGTYSWRYSNWHKTTIYVTFSWGKIDKANIVDERLRALEEDLRLLEGAYNQLNQSLSQLREYLDGLERGSEVYPWLMENLSRAQSETQQILLRMDGMPVNADIEELNGDISELNAQIIELNENITKVQNNNKDYRNDVTMMLGIFILIVAIAMFVVILRGRSRRK